MFIKKTAVGLGRPAGGLRQGIGYFAALCLGFVLVLGTGGVIAQLLGGIGLVQRGVETALASPQVRLVGSMLESQESRALYGRLALAAADSSIGSGYLPTFTLQELAALGSAAQCGTLEQVRVEQGAVVLTMTCTRRSEAEQAALSLRESGAFALVELTLPDGDTSISYQLRCIQKKEEMPYEQFDLRGRGR